MPGLSHQSKIKTCLVVLLASLFSACGTTPPPVRLRAGFDPLPPGLAAYFSLSVPDTRRILNSLVDGTGTRSAGSTYFIENSSRLYGGAAAGLQGFSSFSLLSEGDFSPGLVSFGVRSKSDWREDRFSPGTGSISFFTQQQGKLQIAVPDSRHLLIASSGIEQMLHRLYNPVRNPSIPASRSTEMENSSLGLYLAKPLDLFAVLPAFGIESLLAGITAIDGILIILERDSSGYSMRAEADLSEEKDLRPILVLVKLMIAARLAEAGRSFPAIRDGLKVSQEGRTIRITGIGLTEDEVAKMFQSVLKSAVKEKKE